MTLEASGTIETAAKIQYLRKLVSGEALRKFDKLSDGVESTNPLKVKAVILGLGTYFLPVDFLSKKKRAMRRGMKKPCR